jgi:hypothetical protein
MDKTVKMYIMMYKHSPVGAVEVEEFKNLEDMNQFLQGYSDAFNIRELKVVSGLLLEHRTEDEVQQ